MCGHKSSLDLREPHKKNSSKIMLCNKSHLQLFFQLAQSKCCCTDQILWDLRTLKPQQGEHMLLFSGFGFLHCCLKQEPNILSSLIHLFPFLFIVLSLHQGYDVAVCEIMWISLIYGDKTQLPSSSSLH